MVRALLSREERRRARVREKLARLAGGPPPIAANHHAPGLDPHRQVPPASPNLHQEGNERRQKEPERRFATRVALEREHVRARDEVVDEGLFFMGVRRKRRPGPLGGRNAQERVRATSLRVDDLKLGAVGREGERPPFRVVPRRAQRATARGADLGALAAHIRRPRRARDDDHQEHRANDAEQGEKHNLKDGRQAVPAEELARRGRGRWVHHEAGFGARGALA